MGKRVQKTRDKPTLYTTHICSVSPLDVIRLGTLETVLKTNSMKVLIYFGWALRYLRTTLLT